MANLASGLPAAADPGKLLRDHVFWLSAIPVLLSSYATFEVFFRSRDIKFIGILPLRGRTRALDLLLRSICLLAPLLIAPVAYALALPAGPARTYALLAPTLTFAAALPASTAVHLYAGRTALGGPSALKRYLAQGMIVDDAALLLYAPALALFISLVVLMMTDLFLAEALLGAGASGGNRANLVWPPVGWCLAVAVIGTRQTLVIADQSLHGIIARFTEADAPLPYREDGLPARTPGAGLASALPQRARRYFLRDLRQLRRRYRLDRILLVVFALALLRLDLGLEGPAEGGPTARGPDWSVIALNLAVLGGFVGLLLVSAFRLRGGELGSPWLRQTLPLDRRGEWLGRLAAQAIHPVFATLLAAAGAGLGAGPVEAALTAGLGLPLSGLLIVASDWLAERGLPDHTLAAAALWRCVVVAGLSVLLLTGGSPS